MRLPKISLFILLLLSPLGVLAQYISIQQNYTVPELVNDVLIDNPCASGTNAIAGGWTFSSGASFGAFQANGSGFPFQNGVILTTGMAENAVGPNNSLLSDGPTSWQGDADLEAALGVGNTINATVLEFDFLPLANKFSFDYIFASEQYLTNPSPNQCNYTDGFAFLLKKANTSEPYQNLALVPNTTTPVLVNTVRGPGTLCPQANPQWFDAFNDVDVPINYNGQTRIMTAAASVVPNQLYHIKIVIADQGNNLYDSALFLGGGSFKVTKDLGPDKLIATQNALCPGEQLALDATETGALSYQWFQNDVALAGETNPTYTVTSGGDYRVEIALSSNCDQTGEITVEYAPAPAFSNATLTACDPDANGIGTFDLNQASAQILASAVDVGALTFYENASDAAIGTNAVTNPSGYQSGNATVFARGTNISGCVAVVQVALSVSSVSATPISVAKCDDVVSDGLTSFTLSQEVTPLLSGVPTGSNVSYYASLADADTNQNPLPDSFTNTAIGFQQIFAKVSGSTGCSAIVPIDLTVYFVNPDVLETDEIAICNGQAANLSLSETFDSYLWSDGSSANTITVTSAGNYSVEVTQNGCTYIKNFTVSIPDAPIFEGADVSEFSNGQNSININYSGNADYSFSIDGISYHQSPFFSPLASGEYDIYIRENQCGIIYGPFPVLVLDYPHFFTPNADGYNDYWRIKNLPAGSKVSIFDRFGKLIKTISAQTGWDGTAKGKPLPSTDYWFVLERPGKPSLKAHFSLKR